MPGLIVNGTITRTAVATGADLVAYSGFSASNYLEQPYNASLDFGTGDFCVMGWVDFTSTGNHPIVHRALSGSSGGLLIQTVSGTVSTYLSASTSFSLKLQGGNIPANTKTHVCVMRDSGTLYHYLNGVQVGAVADATNISYTNALLTVGKRQDDGELTGGSLALLRISATAPTAEQIAKIYADERPLFQENAQATLYGSSDAVTALAHDSDTGLLHVGTSAGRSVFQGLRRVSNTTNAVGTAISASNNLIVEE